MAYDRTKTEAAALGLIDEDTVVMCGPIEVPYLSFRKSELNKITDNVQDPEAMLRAVYEIINYRLKGTLPREDFDDYVSLEHAMAYIIDNRTGQKKVVKVAEKPTGAPF